MTDHNQEINDSIGIVKGDTQSQVVIAHFDVDIDHYEVKGPDSDHWGPDDERPSGQPVTANVNEDGETIEVKGPDPDQWGAS